ncbi:unnamed protein product [Cyclocybe aegerita]|uniref:Uncharacterized protein n=1 Tax=Cyclocybe aegerita TaxID=1973307 RepID=A0A8S0XTU8_CYCAE|nr:unnamed protein product [Cyclocybe aegerita]
MTMRTDEHEQVGEDDGGGIMLTMPTHSPSATRTCHPQPSVSLSPTSTSAYPSVSESSHSHPLPPFNKSERKQHNGQSPSTLTSMARRQARTAMVQGRLQCKNLPGERDDEHKHMA